MQSALADFEAEQRAEQAQHGDLALGAQQLARYNQLKVEAGVRAQGIRQQRETLDREQSEEKDKVAGLEDSVRLLDTRLNSIGTQLKEAR